MNIFIDKVKRSCGFTNKHFQNVYGLDELNTLVTTRKFRIAQKESDNDVEQEVKKNEVRE